MIGTPVRMLARPGIQESETFMADRIIALALLLLWPALVLADAEVPDTPAGRAFAAWLDQINEPARQAAFFARYQPFFEPPSVEEWRGDVGGYDLLEVHPDGPTNIFFRVKQRKHRIEEIGRLEVDAKQPMRIKSLGAWRIPPGATVEAKRLGDAARNRVVSSAAGLLERLHEDAKTGRTLAMALRKRLARGDYAGIRYGDELADKVTADLRELGQDRHLQLLFSYAVRTPESETLQAAADARVARANNCGFEKAEHLRPNIGYLKVNFFPDAGTCAATAAAAMNFLADSDALVLDLRDNNGGRADQANYLMSYLFAKPVHTNDVHRRADDVTTQNWTLAEVPGKRFADKPVFVLISSRTFSAGEAVAFVLQDQKRATLVGEATVGGSGTIDFAPLDAHYTLVLPTGHVTSPVTKAQWAGTGVIPDVTVPAPEALETALKLAAAPSP
jgi:hypothetical protein